MKNLIYLILPLILFACSANKKTSNTLTSPTATGADSTCRFVVSFISIGAGIDNKAREEFDKFVLEYSAKNKEHIVYIPERWGREGEIDYCFKLNDLNASKQEEFIREAKGLLKESSLVRYKENVAQRKR